MSAATRTDRVIVTCPDCGRDRQITRKTYRNIRTGKATARCHGCGNSARTRPVIIPGYIPDWRARAACLTVDPEIFFPVGEPGTPAYERAAEPARAVCEQCAVRQICRQVHRWERFGIFAGTTPDERGIRRRK